MKKLQAPKPIATLSLSNTAAVVLSEIDAAGERVKYYVTTGQDLVKVHRAKIYYRRDGTPYFNSVAGRMTLENFMRL